MKFQNPSMTFHKIWHASDFSLLFSKGHNSRKEDNSDKKKNICQLFFLEESINEISKPCTVLDEWMEERTT